MDYEPEDSDEEEEDMISLDSQDWNTFANGAVTLAETDVEPAEAETDEPVSENKSDSQYQWSDIAVACGVVIAISAISILCIKKNKEGDKKTE